MGVPHTELGQILRNGNAVELSYVIQDHCRIEIFPFRSPDHPGSGFSLRGEIRFCCDVHLGTLAKRLRLLGLDTIYNRNWNDEELAEVSIQEKRYLLTRDRQLLMRRKLRLGLYIRKKIPEEQVLEVMTRLNLKLRCKPFSRCLVCNGLLQPFKNEGPVLKRAENRIPPKVKQWCQEFALCQTCDQVYWKGSHFKELKRLVDSYLS
jgi:uncharacterized protein with PIN domain